jgi:hypothetical protein
MSTEELLDLALAALEGADEIDCDMRDAIKAIKQHRALDKKAENARELGLDYEPVLKDNSNYRYDPPVAEPVAYLCENAVGHKYFRWKKPSSEFKPIALYTTPPAQRQWVGLTDEERDEICLGDESIARSIEAKLRDKNGGNHES